VVGSTGCIACTGGATNVEPGTSCNLKPIVNSEASLILSPATYGLYMSASFGLFWYYRIGINSLLVMALIIIDSVGNIIYFLIEPFLYSFLGAAYAFFSFLTVLCLVGHDLNVLLGPFPLYIWAKSTSDAILAPSKKLLSLQEWNMVDGNGKFKILLRCFGGLFIGLLPFIASSILIGFAALVFSLRNIKVIICGLAVYSTFAIVVRPVENWFCETIMSQAPPGSYLMNVENHEPYTRRIIQIYSTHLLVQNLPCLFLLGLNAMSFKSLSGFGYFKLGVAVIVALYGLYFVLAYNQTCSRCLNKKSENKDTEIVKVKVHTSAVAQDETTTPPPPEDAFSKPSPDDDDDDPQHKHLKKRLSPKTSKADLMKDVKKKNPETTDSKDDPNRSSTKKPEESNKPKASKKAAAAGDDAKSNNSVKKSGTTKALVDESKSSSPAPKKPSAKRDGSKTDVSSPAKPKKAASPGDESSPKPKKSPSPAGGDESKTNSSDPAKKKKKKQSSGASKPDGPPKPKPGSGGSSDKLTAQFTFGSIQ
jgi:hypothetical protein